MAESDGELTLELPAELEDEEIETLKSDRKYWIPLLLAPIVAVVTGLLSYRGLAEYEEWVIDVSHTQISNVIASQVRSSLLLATKDCWGVSILFGKSESVSVEDFRRYVEFIDKDGHSYFHALEWIPKISAENIQAYSDRMQTPYKDRYLAVNPNSTYPGFNFYGIDDKELGDVIYPVYYVEPYENNIVAHGLDLASNLVRLEAINQAMTGISTASKRIRLVQETGTQNGYLLFVPVYQGQKVTGFAVGVYRLGNLLSFSLEGVGHDGIIVHLFDVTDGINELLYSEDPTATDDSYYTSENLLSHVIPFNTRRWELLIVRTDSFEESKKTSTPIVTSILLSIVLGTTTLFVFGMISKSRISKKNLEYILQVSAKIASAVSTMDFDSVAFMKTVKKDSHPLLLAFKDIVDVLCEYERFLPDVIRNTNMNLIKVTPTQEVVRDLQANIALAALDRQFISPHTPGVKSAHITAVAFSFSSTAIATEEQTNLMFSTIHSTVREMKGFITITGATQIQSAFTGYSTTQATSTVRMILKELEQLSISVTMTQGRCQISIAGGEAARYPVIHGSVTSLLDELTSYAHALNITTLCAEMQDHDIRCNFVDHIGGGRSIFQFPFHADEQETALWLFCEGDDLSQKYRDFVKACVLMSNWEFDAALPILKSCPSCSIIDHHIQRAEIKSTAPLAISFAAVPPILNAPKRKRRAKGVCTQQQPAADSAP